MRWLKCNREFASERSRVSVFAINITITIYILSIWKMQVRTNSVDLPLRKHAYSKYMEKISPPKTENFSDKKM